MWFHLRLLEKCNLKCTSCYAKEHDKVQIMDFKLFKDILNEIKKITRSRQDKSVIYLSGGEPLLHPDFFRMLDYCFSQFDRVSILTNGVLIEKHIKKLLPYKEKLCVQVSLDGDKNINDQIRGNGVYDRTLEALAILNKNNINHWISYTVSKLNKVLNGPEYNYLIHASPNRFERRGYWRTIHDDYHWHIELFPRLTRTAGFEWGTGFYINPTAPEDAAKILRDQTV